MRKRGIYAKKFVGKGKEHISRRYKKKKNLNFQNWDSKFTSKLTCSLSLDVDVRLIVKAWLKQGPVPAVVETQVPVPVGPDEVKLG